MKTLFALALFNCIPLSLAAQDSWNVTGRTNVVEVERREFGDVNVRIDLSYIDAELSSLAITASGFCAGSYDSTCTALAASPSCTWNALSYSSRAALNSLVGGAWCGPEGHPQCLTVTGVFPWGEHFTSQQWYCSGAPYSANCNTMFGKLTPGHRITLVGQTSGCTL